MPSPRPINCTRVAIATYAVPDELGLAIGILAPEFGLQQIGTSRPAPDALLGQQLGIEAEAQGRRHRYRRSCRPSRCSRFTAQGGFAEARRLVDIGRLPRRPARIAGAAEPDIALWGSCLGL